MEEMGVPVQEQLRKVESPNIIALQNLKAPECNEIAETSWNYGEEDRFITS